MSGVKLEPVHIHIKKENKEAKFWISPVALAYNEGFSRSDLKDMERIIISNSDLINKKWNEFFRDLL